MNSQPPSSALLLAAIAFTLPPASSAGPLTWEDAGGAGAAAISVRPGGHDGFTIMDPADTRVTFANEVPEYLHLKNQILLNGSGVAAGDLDGDGLCDLYFCRLDGPNGFYRNLGGWRFEESARAAGVACEESRSTGAAIADLDGNGSLDLVVNSLGGGTSVFINDGSGRFHRQGGLLNQGRGGMTVAIADVNRDGFPDLYIANYRTRGLMDMPNARATFEVRDGRKVVATVDGVSTDTPALKNRFHVAADGTLHELGEPDVLYLNNGGRGWTPADTSKTFLTAGGRTFASPPLDWGLAAMFRDIDRDGDPDLYVCNDFDSPDRLWMNRGDGTFTLAPAESFRSTSRYSMAVDVADVNRDGLDDVFVLDMLSRDPARRKQFMEDAPTTGIFSDVDAPIQASRNTLQLNRGGGLFSEIGRFAGIAASGWSWTAAFLDVDLDGYEDILVGNGVERAARDLDVIGFLKQKRARQKMSDREIFQLRRMFPKLHSGNAAFRNHGDLTFASADGDWNFNLVGITTGMALCDLDNDGDQDVVLNNFNGPSTLYRNESSRPRIQARLLGNTANTSGISARITVASDGMPEQSQEITAGGRYLSGDQLTRTFALKTPGSTATITVDWPDGSRTFVSKAKANTIVRVPQDGATLPGPAPAPKGRLFPEVHVPRTDGSPDDRAVSVPQYPLNLKPRRSLVAFDIDRDGLDDLIIGAVAGQPLRVLLSRPPGFEISNVPLLHPDLGSPATYTGTSLAAIGGVVSQRDGNHGTSIHLLEFTPEPRLLELNVASRIEGPIALGDIDGDEDIDLFVSGRGTPGTETPETPCRVFINDGSELHLAMAWSANLGGIGTVNGATFSDIDNDGDPDLILARDWAPITLFENTGDSLVSITEESGLSGFPGWWSSVAVRDLDGDGLADITASNMGLNTYHDTYATDHFGLFVGDWDGDGIMETVECYEDAERNAYIPIGSLRAISEKLPFIKARTRSNRAYSTADMDKLLGDLKPAFHFVGARWHASTVFLNRGGRFTPVVLPSQVQLSTSGSITPGDFDGDQITDLLVAQSAFADSSGPSPGNEGSALLLIGKGDGSFSAIEPASSGFPANRGQEASAAGDFDGDGNLDAAFIDGNGSLAVFRNATTR